MGSEKSGPFPFSHLTKGHAMRDRTVNVILWSEALLLCWVWPLFKQYLIYSGIVFNAFLIILLIWG